MRHARRQLLMRRRCRFSVGLPGERDLDLHCRVPNYGTVEHTQTSGPITATGQGGTKKTGYITFQNFACNPEFGLVIAYFESQGWNGHVINDGTTNAACFYNVRPDVFSTTTCGYQACNNLPRRNRHGRQRLPDHERRRWRVVRLRCWLSACGLDRAAGADNATAKSA